MSMNPFKQPPLADEVHRAASGREFAAQTGGAGVAFTPIKVEDIAVADSVTITIGKRDGRCLRRVVPRECWEEPSYRASLIRDMGLLLA